MSIAVGSMLPRCFCLSALLAAWVSFPLAAQTSAPAAPASAFPADAARRATEMLLSMDPTTRRKAADALWSRSMQPGGREPVLELLATVRQKQKEALEVVVKRGAPALTRFKENHDEWARQCTETMKLIRTDYHKAADKVAMLTREHVGVEKLRKSMDRGETAAEAAWKPLETATEPLEEVDRVVARVKSLTDPYVPKKPLDYLKEIPAAGDLLAAHAALLKRQQDLALQKTVFEHNKACKWAPKSGIAFANILNEKRAVVGLPPFRLDEALSQAATDHSKEMIALKYFAHESPKAENKTPGDRAKNARFAGAWSGENIYMGSPAPDGAYSGWWGSDGHRFIMFASGPNTLGIGPVGGHWTMMTGDKAWK